MSPSLHVSLPAFLSPPLPPFLPLSLCPTFSPSRVRGLFSVVDSIRLLRLQCNAMQRDATRCNVMRCVCREEFKEEMTDYMNEMKVDTPNPLPNHLPPSLSQPPAAPNCEGSCELLDQV